jgi:hypothetical protein
VAIDYYETLGGEDINVGVDTFVSRNPGGGTLTSTQVGIHTFAVGQLKATATWNPASVSAGQSVTTTVTVTGASLGDFTMASFSLSLAGLVLNSYVSAANTVTAVLSNPTSAAIDLASGTLAVLVLKSR